MCRSFAQVLCTGPLRRSFEVSLHWQTEPTIWFALLGFFRHPFAPATINRCQVFFEGHNVDTGPCASECLQAADALAEVMQKRREGRLHELLWPVITSSGLGGLSSGVEHRSQGKTCLCAQMLCGCSVSALKRGCLFLILGSLVATKLNAGIHQSEDGISGIS